MKSQLLYFRLCGLVLTLSCFANARAQELAEKSSFEGVVSFESRDFQSIEPRTLFVKHGVLRIEGTEQAGGNAFLIDYAKKKAFIVLSAREQYVELPAVILPAKGDTKQTRVNVQKTDSTLDILDFTCDEFLVTTDSLEFEIWATKGLGTAGTFLNAQVNEWQWKILEMGYFPLRVVVRDASGDESARLEATSVTKKAMSEALFRLPSGYEKVDQESIQSKPSVKKRKR